MFINYNVIGKGNIDVPIGLLIVSQSDLRVLEMKGPTTSMQAVFAHIVKKRREQSSIGIGIRFEEFSIHVDPRTDRFKSMIIDGHFCVFHHGFSDMQRTMLIGANDPKEPAKGFYAAMQRNVAVPIHPSWTKVLWDLGLEKRCIAQYQTWYGNRTAFEISTDASFWMDRVIKPALADGRLPWPIN